jgi:hypothetical protein
MTPVVSARVPPDASEVGDGRVLSEQLSVAAKAARRVVPQSHRTAEPDASRVTDPCLGLAHAWYGRASGNCSMRRHYSPTKSANPAQ